MGKIYTNVNLIEVFDGNEFKIIPIEFMNKGDIFRVSSEENYVSDREMNNAFVVDDVIKHYSGYWAINYVEEGQ